MRIVISPSRPFDCAIAGGGQCGGIAGIGSFDYSADVPVFVFTTGRSSAKFIGEASSHEVGYSLGLHHDGQDLPGVDHLEYFEGQGTWAPIMGVGYGKEVTQWRGE